MESELERKRQSSWFCDFDLLTLFPSPVMSKVDMLPGKVIVKMGMMPVIPTPEMESFAAHKHTWFKKPEGVTSYKILRTGEVMED